MTMSGGVRARLSLMMFGQYFVIGSWFVTLGAYMSKGLRFDAIIGVAYGFQGVAVIMTTLLIGNLCDRFLSAQKVMGVLTLLSGVALLWASTVQHSRSLFLAAVLAHFMLYMPTVPLATAVTFNAISDSAKQFPLIRVFGTLGWICAGLLIGSIPGAAQTSLPMQLGGCTALLLGLYAFTLPDTPARSSSRGTSMLQLLGLDVVLRMRERAFWVFIASSLLVLIPLSFYYAYCNNFLVETQARLVVFDRAFEPAAIQTLGQVSEALFMLLLPLLFIRMGIKRVLLTGMLAWVVRYILFAQGFNEFGPVMTLLLAGIALHGVCNDCFFVAGQVYVDQKFRASERARAQSFLSLVTSGIGVVVGSNVAGFVYERNTISPSEHDWYSIWWISALLALAIAVGFALSFRERLPQDMEPPDGTGVQHAQ